MVGDNLEWEITAPSASAFMLFGMTATIPDCHPIARFAPIGSSAHYRSFCGDPRSYNAAIA